MPFDNLRREREERERTRKEQEANIQVQMEARCNRAREYYKSSGLEQLLVEFCVATGSRIVNHSPPYIEGRFHPRLVDINYRYLPHGQDCLLQQVLDNTKTCAVLSLVVAVNSVDFFSSKKSVIVVACYEEGTIDIVGRQTRRISYQEWGNNLRRLEVELEHAYRYPYIWVYKVGRDREW